MQDYSDTCPWTYLAECVEADMFPQELLDKLKEENKELKEENIKLQHDHERPMLAYKTFHSADSEEYIEWVKGCKIYQELEEENKQVIRVLNRVRKDKEQLEEKYEK